MTEPLNVGQEFIKRLRKYNEGTIPIMGDIVEIDEWRNVAMKIGEKLSPAGRPDDYYNFTPQQWFEWADSQINSRWIPTGERLPNHGEDILIIEICPLDNSSKDIIVASVLSDGWWWRKDTGHMVNPHAFSHWMPLPLSPKDSIRKKKE